MWCRPGAKAGKAESVRKARRGKAVALITISTDRTTGVMSTARQEGNHASVGEARDGGRGRGPANEIGKDVVPFGRRRGPDVPLKPGNAGGGKGPCFWERL